MFLSHSVVLRLVIAATVVAPGLMGQSLSPTGDRPLETNETLLPIPDTAETPTEDAALNVVITGRPGEIFVLSVKYGDLPSMPLLVGRIPETGAEVTGVALPSQLRNSSKPLALVLHVPTHRTDERTTLDGSTADGKGEQGIRDLAEAIKSCYDKKQPYGVLDPNEFHEWFKDVDTGAPKPFIDEEELETWMKNKDLRYPDATWKELIKRYDKCPKDGQLNMTEMNKFRKEINNGVFDNPFPTLVIMLGSPTLVGGMTTPDTSDSAIK